MGPPSIPAMPPPNPTTTVKRQMMVPRPPPTTGVALSHSQHTGDVLSEFDVPELSQCWPAAGIMPTDNYGGMDLATIHSVMGEMQPPLPENYFVQMNEVQAPLLDNGMVNYLYGNMFSEIFPSAEAEALPSQNDFGFQTTPSLLVNWNGGQAETT